MLPAGSAGADSDNAGGGAGAVGRVRINVAGAPAVDGLVSPAEATGAFTTGPLVVISN